MQWRFLSEHENIENERNTYSQEAVCYMAGYANLGAEADMDESTLANLYKTFTDLPEHFAHLSLVVSQGKTFAISPRDWKIQEIYTDTILEDTLKQEMTSWACKPLKTDETLCQFAFLHTGNGQLYILQKYHHLIMDKQSILLVTSWQEKYFQALQEQNVQIIEELRLPDTRYLDYLTQMNQQDNFTDTARVKTWLQEHFADTSREWMEHKVSLNPASAKIKCKIDRKWNKQINDYALQHRISTEAIWYLAIFAENFLRKGTSHGVLGRMIQNRKRGYLDVAGLFSTALPVALSCDTADTIETLLGKIQSFFMTSLRYHEYSLRQMHEWSQGGTDFDVLISFHREQDLMQSQYQVEEILIPYIDTPLRIWINQWEEGTELEIFYQTDCYTPEEAEAWQKRILHLMQQIVQGTSWQSLSLLTKADLRAYELLQQESSQNHPLELDIHQSFLKHCYDNLEHCILEDSVSSLTGKDCIYWYMTLIDILKENGLKKGQVVGLQLKRCVQLPLFMLAILEEQASFLPVSPMESVERVTEIKTHCDLFFTWEDIENIPQNTDIDLAIFSQQSPKSSTYPSIHDLKQRVAYHMFTSGSTGTPKEVIISVYSLMCRLEWMHQTLQQDATTLQKTRNTFDVSIWELLLAPIYGGKLCLLEEGDEIYPDKIYQAIEKYQITRIHFVPSMLTAFVGYLERLDAPGCSSIAEIIVSGEALGADLVQRTYHVLPDAKIYNLYGPTECTIDVSYHLCSPEEREIPIGKAVANTELYVMNKNHSTLLPVGTPGELCVAGDLVGMGYVEQAEDTTKTSSDKQGGFGYCESLQKRIYKTGDIVSLREDGNLMYHGRKDRQTKLRGMRIDLLEIENALNSFEKIESSYVWLLGNQLIAAIWSKQTISTEELKKELRTKLPFYEIPNDYFCLESFPTGKNGKLDTRQIKALYTAKQEQTPTPELDNVSKREMQLLDICHQLFPGKRLTLDSDLFEAGLDSLLALRLIEAMQDKGWNIAYDGIYRNPTIRELANNEEKTGTSILSYLKKDNLTTLYLTVPFGGGGPESFRDYMSTNTDFAIVNLSDETDTSPERTQELASYIAEEILPYDEIHLRGYCVGSALASEIARVCQANHKCIASMEIYGSYPSYSIMTKGKIYSPWDKKSDQDIRKSLAKAGGSTEIPDNKIQQFRRDVERYLYYMKWHRDKKIPPVSIPVSLYYGIKDPFTKGWKHKANRWKDFFSGELSVVSVEKKGHYFWKNHHNPCE